MRLMLMSVAQDGDKLIHKIRTRLRKFGHTFWSDEAVAKQDVLTILGNTASSDGQVFVGVENAAASLEQALLHSDAVIAILTAEAFSNTAFQSSLTTLALRDDDHTRWPLLAIKVESIPVPSYLSSKFIVDLSDGFEKSMIRLNSLLLAYEKRPRKPKKVISSKSIRKKPERKPKPTTHEDHGEKLDLLRDALRRGKLTLVCGAGISVAAGIPSWNHLLVQLLAKVLKPVTDGPDLLDRKGMAEKLRDRSGASPLILGKFLKNSLGDDFAVAVREALYISNPTTSDIIESIVLLSQPQREGKPLDSIVNFNFDCLIEENLDAARVRNKKIFCDPTIHEPNVLPIYHVHGYLPRTGPIPIGTALVFAEDAYHTQFTDPFSWSNLVLLNKLTQNVCLFVGISLTDPNMRRLLDVAWRKNPKKAHFIIKRATEPSGDLEFDRISRTLEEQDANALGLNVIQVHQFEEIAPFLKGIAEQG